MYDAGQEHDDSRAGLSRRRVLTGGLALGAAMVAGGAGAGTAAAGIAAISSYSSIGTNPRLPMRRRTSWQTVGGRTIGYHSPAAGQSFGFDTTFHSMCDSWVNYTSTMWGRFSGTGTRPAWVGTAGVYVNKPGNHGTGNAFDLTALYFANGGYIDCYYSHQWSAPANHQRWYLGLAWCGRRFFPELGIVGTGGGHDNHIHLGRYKNGSASLLFSKTAWDTWLMQRTCRVLMQVNIALDGRWGSQTESYYRTLMSRLGLGGYNPFGNMSHFASMVYAIAARGMASRTV